jgi:purine-binding chemotaxis protein CheW
VADAKGQSGFEAVSRRLDEAERALSGRESAEKRRRILDERAREIAVSRDETAVESVPVLVFHVGGERYAVGVTTVFQVLDTRGLHPLPGAPPWLLGAMVARTRVVPVLDLRQLLGLAGGGLSDLGHVVVVEHKGEAFGLAAESLEGRVDVPRTGLGAPVDGPFAWVAPDRLALLDLDKLGAPAARGG